MASDCADCDHSHPAGTHDVATAQPTRATAASGATNAVSAGHANVVVAENADGADDEASAEPDDEAGNATEDIVGKGEADVALPRIVITFCTQCRWMLRAAYYAQELLSTFAGTTLGEVALKPATGGVFTVEMVYRPASTDSGASGDSEHVMKALIWDRKAEGGFPETKVLKQRVRDYIDPDRDLGHSDRHGKK